MRLTLAHIGPRLAADDEFDRLTHTYVLRCAIYSKCDTEAFRTEKALVDWLGRQQGRTATLLVLLDPRGRTMSSEAFAAWLGTRRDEGSQHIVFAIGPANGWDDAMRQKAQLLLSLGPFTLAHALARLVLAEQLYRACTILAGHPYHSGH